MRAISGSASPAAVAVDLKAVFFGRFESCIFFPG
jgi:hypothetical protein